MPTRDEYVENLKSVALSMGKKLVMEQLIKKIPFFSLALPNKLAALVIGKILEILIRETEVAAFFLYIDMRSSQQGRDFDEAAFKNREAQINGTEDEKRVAERDLVAHLRRLAVYSR